MIKNLDNVFKIHFLNLTVAIYNMPSLYRGKNYTVKPQVKSRQGLPEVG